MEIKTVEKTVQRKIKTFITSDGQEFYSAYDAKIHEATKIIGPELDKLYAVEKAPHFPIQREGHFHYVDVPAERVSTAMSDLGILLRKFLTLEPDNPNLHAFHTASGHTITIPGKYVVFTFQDGNTFEFDTLRVYTIEQIETQLNEQITKIQTLLENLRQTKETKQ